MRHRQAAAGTTHLVGRHALCLCLLDHHRRGRAVALEGLDPVAPLQTSARENLVEEVAATLEIEIEEVPVGSEGVAGVEIVREIPLPQQRCLEVFLASLEVEEIVGVVVEMGGGA